MILTAMLQKNFVMPNIDTELKWNLFFKVIKTMELPVEINIIKMFNNLRSDLTNFPYQKFVDSTFPELIIQTITIILEKNPYYSELSQYLYALFIFIQYDPVLFCSIDYISPLLRILENSTGSAKIYALQILYYFAQNPKSGSILVESYNFLPALAEQLIHDETIDFITNLKLRILAPLCNYCNDPKMLSIFLERSLFLIQNQSPIFQKDGMEVIFSIISKLPSPSPPYVPLRPFSIYYLLNEQEIVPHGTSEELPQQIIQILYEIHFFEFIPHFLRIAPDDALDSIFRTLSILFSNDCAKFIDVITLSKFLFIVIKRTNKAIPAIGLAFVAQFLQIIASVDGSSFLELLQLLFEILSDGSFQSRAAALKGICLILSSDNKELIKLIYNRNLMDLMTQIAMSNEYYLLEMILQAINNMYQFQILPPDFLDSYQDFYEFLCEMSDNGDHTSLSAQVKTYLSLWTPKKEQNLN